MISRKRLLSDIGCVERTTMYEDMFRKGYLHHHGLILGIVSRASAVNPVKAAGGVNCWGCRYHNKEAGTCIRPVAAGFGQEFSVTPQDFCSFGYAKK